MLPAIPLAPFTARMSKAKHAASRINRRTLFHVPQSRDARYLHYVCSVPRNNIEDEAWPRSGQGAKAGAGAAARLGFELSGNREAESDGLLIRRSAFRERCHWITDHSRQAHRG